MLIDKPSWRDARRLLHFPGTELTLARAFARGHKQSRQRTPGLSLLMRGGRDYLKCAVLYYGYMLEMTGSSRVADAAKQFGFVNPSAGTSVADLPPDVPLFIARAGQDHMPGLNAALDDFVDEALTPNLPVTVINHAGGAHAFDLFHDSEMSREIIRQTLAFMRFHLTA